MERGEGRPRQIQRELERERERERERPRVRQLEKGEKDKIISKERKTRRVSGIL